MKRAILAVMKTANTSNDTVSRKFLAVLSLVMMTVYVVLKVMYEIGSSMIWEVRTASDHRYEASLTFRNKLFWLIAALA